MRFFLAGIMQGSHVGALIHDQTYRERLKSRLRRAFPGAEIYDPLADHHQSLDYQDDRAREVFFTHNRLCGEVDVVVAYLPEASMGTAIEMWEAHRLGRIVAVISPLRHNWVVRFCSHLWYPDLEAFEADLASGGLAQRLADLGAGR